MGLGIFGGQFHGSPATGRGGFQFALFLQNGAEVVVHVGAIRINLQNPPVAGGGFLEISLLLQYCAKVVMRVRKIGFQLEGPPIAIGASSNRPCFSKMAPRLLCASAYRGFSSIARRWDSAASSNRSCLPSTLPRFVCTSAMSGLSLIASRYSASDSASFPCVSSAVPDHCAPRDYRTSVPGIAGSRRRPGASHPTAPHHAEMVLGVGKIRLQLHGPRQACHRVRQLAKRMTRRAEQVKDFGILRLGLNHLPVASFGVANPPRAMIGLARRKCFRAGQHANTRANRDAHGNPNSASRISQEITPTKSTADRDVPAVIVARPERAASRPKTHYGRPEAGGLISDVDPVEVPIRLAGFEPATYGLGNRCSIP